MVKIQEWLQTWCGVVAWVVFAFGVVYWTHEPDKAMPEYKGFAETRAEFFKSTNRYDYLDRANERLIDSRR